MFEFLLSEWHITPDYIVNNWTEELLVLMVEKLAERKQRELNAIRGHASPEKVSDTSLFAHARNLIKLVKKN